jgi:hypothetical protein
MSSVAILAGVALGAAMAAVPTVPLFNAAVPNLRMPAMGLGEDILGQVMS